MKNKVLWFIDFLFKNTFKEISDELGKPISSLSSVYYRALNVAKYIFYMNAGVSLKSETKYKTLLKNTDTIRLEGVSKRR